MTAPRPIDVVRKDGALVPKSQRWLFDRMFAEGEEYSIEIHEPVSRKSHNHFHAAVNEAWKNLRESDAAQHPDADHLRKWALIKTGWCIKRNVVCETIEQAYAIAAVAGQLDESAVVVVQGKVVTIATARSQKTTGPNCMSREEFQKSKQDVLDYIAGLIGVDAATLSSQVPNSSDAQSQANSDRTDTPAGSSGPQPLPAGVSYSGEPSKLPSDWFDLYVMTLTKSQNRALSVLSRDEAARKLLGPPNEWERDIQRRVATWVNKRDLGKIKADEFQAGISAIRAEWVKATKGAKDAA